MTIPNLKRVRISSEEELRGLLAKQPEQDASVMLVTHAKDTHPKYVSHQQVGEVVAAHGWVAGRRYTLNGALIGHVVSKSAASR